MKPVLSKIALQYLRYVLVAADRRSFRQAAAELGVWESTVSRGIRDLEDEIGVALFVRHSGGVMLTNAGEKFLGHARTAIGQIEYALKGAGAAGRGEVGMVRIGIFSSLASGFLADLLHAYQAENPRVRLDFTEGGLAQHVAAVQHHRMDVAFLTGAPIVYGCETTHLWDEQVFAVIPHDHVLARCERIDWDDLRDEHFLVTDTDPGPEIHDYLVKHLAELGRHPSVERCGVGRDNLMRLVALGRGLTLTSEATTGAMFPGITYKLLKTEKLPFCAVWSPRNDNPAFRRFMSAARTLAKQQATTFG
ncbi:LysR substrate-binding domain-containing protein [Hyphomicrobium sp. 2TAF46]|uniref:LysR substrate-binding domain-containing protein n=1 Tax=Hyphomicrobium sp. 2TAF46 TaxID=3233019 RepID=UPI003F8FE504